MIVAVTGASGFIGRHVLAELAGREVEAVAVSRDATRLSHCGADVNVVELDVSLANRDSFSLLGRPDAIIHLAWEGLPNYRSLHHFETELPRHYHFLKTLVESGLSCVVVAGTCFEYGMRSGALSEDLPAAPTNPYGYAKDALRRQLDFLKAERDFACVWPRLFYMYGPGQSPSAIYPQLKAAVERGDTVFNMSGGEQLRDYLPVEEVARCLVELTLSGPSSGVVNVCSGAPVSVRRLVENWLQENKWKIELNLGYYPYPDYEPMAFWGDRRRLDNILSKR